MAVLTQCLSGVPSNVANIHLRVFVPLKGEGFLVELLFWLGALVFLGFLMYTLLCMFLSGRFLVCLGRKAVCICLSVRLERSQS